MRVLITGSAGFLGRHLVQQCLDKGYEVIGLDLKASGIRHGHFQEQACDVTQELKVKELVASAAPDVVVHCAAALAQFVRDKSRLHDINENGTKYLLEAAFAAKVKQFIFLSSVEVYGIDVPVPCPETAPFNPICQYGRDKVACEQMCHDYLQKGMSVTLLRPPTIAGPGQNEPSLLGQVKSAHLGKAILLPGGGQTRLQMVDVRDVCQAIHLAMNNPKARGAVLNVCSDTVPTMREMLTALFQHAGQPLKIKALSPKVARFMVKLLHKLHLSPVEPQHLEIVLRDYIFDNRKAKEVLGWQPTKTDVESAIDTYDWYVREVLPKESKGKGG